MSRGRKATPLDLAAWDLAYVTPSQYRYLHLRSQGLGPLAISRLLNVNARTVRDSLLEARRTQWLYTGRKV